ARNGADQLLSNRGIHSKAERAPWWTVRFDPPVECDGIRIWNRSDGWGRRSRTLRIDMETVGNASKQCVYDGQSRVRLIDALDALSKAAGVQGLATWPVTASAAREWREGLLARFAARLSAGETNLATVNWRALLQVVDVWGREEPS